MSKLSHHGDFLSLPYEREEDVCSSAVSGGGSIIDVTEDRSHVDKENTENATNISDLETHKDTLSHKREDVARERHLENLPDNVAENETSLIKKKPRKGKRQKGKNVMRKEVQRQEGLEPDDLSKTKGYLDLEKDIPYSAIEGSDMSQKCKEYIHILWTDMRKKMDETNKVSDCVKEKSSCQDSCGEEKLHIFEYKGVIVVDEGVLNTENTNCYHKENKSKVNTETFIQALLSEAGATTNMDGEPMKQLLETIEQCSLKRYEYTKKVGLFSSGYHDFNDFIGFVTGEIFLTSEFRNMFEEERRTKNGTTTDSLMRFKLHSYLMFHSHIPLVIDCRKKGNSMRFIRKSCQPNTILKGIFINDKNKPGDFTFYLGLFARESICPDQEFFLPPDYDIGNDFYSYSCACDNEEYCLAKYPIPTNTPKKHHFAQETPKKEHKRPRLSSLPTDCPGQRKGIGNSKNSPDQARVDKSTEYYKENVWLNQNNSTNMPTREERKLQMYIRTIQKIEHREEKKKNRQNSRKKNTGV